MSFAIWRGARTDILKGIDKLGKQMRDFVAQELYRVFQWRCHPQGEVLRHRGWRHEFVRPAVTCEPIHKPSLPSGSVC